MRVWMWFWMQFSWLAVIATNCIQTRLQTKDRCKYYLQMRRGHQTRIRDLSNFKDDHKDCSFIPPPVPVFDLKKKSLESPLPPAMIRVVESEESMDVMDSSRNLWTSGSVTSLSAGQSLWRITAAFRDRRTQKWFCKKVATTVLRNQPISIMQWPTWKSYFFFMDYIIIIFGENSTNSIMQR